MQFLSEVGNNPDRIPRRGVHDRECQIREIFFEDFQIFHDGIFTEKLCQTHEDFCEEHNQHVPNYRVFGPVPDRSHLGPFFQIPDTLLCPVPVLAGGQDLLRIIIDT